MVAMHSKIEDLPSSSKKRDGFEFRRTPRHHQPSRFAREKAGLKFKDKGVRIENQIRPPYADQPLDFVKNAENGYVVQAKYPGNQQGMKDSSSSSEDELIKYMYKVPKFLQKGEMTQDNALNFGVLDWGRLEQWSHKQTSASVHSTLKPMKGKMVNPSEIVTLKSPKNKKEVNSGKVKPSSTEGVDSKSTKGKEKCFDEDNTYIEEIRSSKLEKESVVLILPKDFSKPCTSSEVSPKPPRLGKSGQHNWGSFSDLFSVDEIQTDDSFSGAIPRNHVLDTENDLDLKLDTLIKAQDETKTKTVHLPNMNTKSNNGSDQSEPLCSVEKTGESLKHHRRGFSLGRMTKSFSFKEGSASCETSSSSKSQIPAKTRSGPLKMLLGPLFKPKVVNQIKENSNDSTIDPPIPVMVPEVENNEASTVKAFLHLTVKSGLPLFKFVAETKNEILASTVSFGEVDISLMYTFYSVHKFRKKNTGWKNHKVNNNNNNKPCGFVYNVVGQMKVSKPKETEEIRKVKESVLYSVDVSKADGVASELSIGRELAAVVVNMPYETENCNEGEKLGETMVILPHGDHSVPHEGVPSSLINRWRTGGLCDCGGWDEGCKLRILGDMKDLICSRSRSMNFRCDLYDQEESKQCKPFFRVVPFRDGQFSVEFDTKMSSLQAFSICVAVINSKQPVELGAIKTPSILNEGRERHTRTHSHPPVSPTGRV